MDLIYILALTLIVGAVLEQLYQHLFFYQPLCFKITASKTYHAFTAKERLIKFHRRRQIISTVIGVCLLLFLTGLELIDAGNRLINGIFLLSIICMAIPICEITYYQWRTGKYRKPVMTAPEMRAYHDFCERYSQHSFSLNGRYRSRLRFYSLAIGIIILLVLSTIV